jgi:hypothetical protein
MLCWSLSVVAHGAIAAGKRVVAVAHIPGQVGRHARHLIRHHLGLGHGVVAHRTARAIWHASVVCVPGASLLAIFGPPATDRVAGWLPTAYPGTGATTGAGGGTAPVALVPSHDPYTTIMRDQPPINAPEPASVLVFGGAAMMTMVARRFRRGWRHRPRAPQV